MEGLTYLNSRAVGMLVNFFNQVSQQGKQMVFCNLKGGVYDTLNLVGVGQIIAFHDDLDSAIGSFV
jgi:anti-anti-sigma factor